jgi:cyclohexanone monooxygenase
MPASESKTASAPGRNGDFDVIIVGAGFAGIYMLYRMRKLGLRALCIESGSDVGGTWYWNRYPGARCDAVSALYSFSFSEELQQEWSWSELYSSQSEILEYLRHVADRFDLKKDMWFDTRVEKAAFDALANRWNVVTDKNDRLSARYCVLATGCLSLARLPDIEGIADAKIPVYHTGYWPHEGVDFSGKRVGIVGTGSSAIQAIPEIAKQASELRVYQRTPSYVVPSRNGPTDREEERYIKEHYPEIRQCWRKGELVGAGEMLRPGIIYRRSISAFSVSDEEREQEYQSRWERGGNAFNAAYGDLWTDERANETSASFVRRKIAEIVDDPITAAKLTPHTYPIGSRRLCISDEYYQAFNRANVTLVDLRETPIERVVEDGIRTSAGEDRLDALVFATGFDAMTGAILAMDIRGRDGIELRDTWRAGPTNYLGLMVHGYPNLFTITGPGSPSVLGNVVNCIEQHVEFVTDLIDHLTSNGLDQVEADADAEDKWVERVNTDAATTLLPRGNSWYMGGNVPGKPEVFMPFVRGMGIYRKVCEDVARDGYAGFKLRPEQASSENSERQNDLERLN